MGITNRPATFDEILSTFRNTLADSERQLQDPSATFRTCKDLHTDMKSCVPSGGMANPVVATLVDALGECLTLCERLHDQVQDVLTEHHDDVVSSTYPDVDADLDPPNG